MDKEGDGKGEKAGDVAEAQTGEAVRGKEAGIHPRAAEGLRKGFLEAGVFWVLRKWGIEGLENVRDDAAAYNLGVKTGRFFWWLLVGVVVVFGSGFAISSCRRNGVAEVQKELATGYKGDRDDALRKKDEAERARDHLEASRDRLNDRLALIELRANLQVQSNAPPDRRIDAILEELAALGPGAFKFDVDVNGVSLTNNASVVVGTNRTVRLSARNMSKMTAENLTLVFTPFTDATNIIAPGWELRGHGDLEPGGRAPMFRQRSEVSMASMQFFGGSEITVSTNYTPGILRVFIAVHADRSPQRGGHVNLVFGAPP